MPAGKVHLTRLQSHLETEYAWLRDDLLAAQPNLDKPSLRTRLLLGFALNNIAGCPRDEIAEHITDGPDDRGIDAFYYNTEKDDVYIFQSKYVDSPRTTPLSERDALAFADGIDAICSLDIFKDCNDRIKQLEEEIRAAITTADVDLHPILVSTSERDILKKVQNRLESKFSNSMDDKNALRYMRLSDLYEHISLYGGGAGAEIQLTLNGYRMIPLPYNGYYGWLTGETLANLFKTHGPKLFSSNLRSSLGKTAINDDMLTTAQTSPEHFWYFNNGVTFVSNSISRTLRGGADADYIDLTIKNGSIVNGAQTTSTLSKLLDSEEGKEQLAHIRCLVRILEIPADSKEFARDVTRFNNSQNEIGAKDFVSLDPFQQELRKLLEREFAVTYIIRSGEEIGSQNTSAITLQEATLALVACGESIDNAVRSKDKISSLWRDTTKAPYTTIFDREKVTPLALRKAVCANRLVEQFLKTKSVRTKGSADKSKRDRMATIAIHGNRLFSFYILRGINIFREEQSYDEFELKISELDLEDHFISFVNEVFAQFDTSYKAVLFKNTRKCSMILAKLPTVRLPVR